MRSTVANLDGKLNDQMSFLAGHLLATEYNLLNGTDTCIVAVRGEAERVP